MIYIYTYDYANKPFISLGERDSLEIEIKKWLKISAHAGYTEYLLILIHLYYILSEGLGGISINILIAGTNSINIA